MGCKLLASSTMLTLLMRTSSSHPGSHLTSMATYLSGATVCGTDTPLGIFGAVMASHWAHENRAKASRMGCGARAAMSIRCMSGTEACARFVCILLIAASAPKPDRPIGSTSPRARTETRSSDKDSLISCCASRPLMTAVTSKVWRDFGLHLLSVTPTVAEDEDTT